MVAARATVSMATTTGQMTLSTTENSISDQLNAVDAQLTSTSAGHRNAAVAEADTPRVTLAAIDSSRRRIDAAGDSLPISLFSSASVGSSELPKATTVRLCRDGEY
ncbi:hypothetical protein AXF42_Ash016105 [Apostasia shenzhenica]|uniref:Uncharacterized protein n=1 Tax=Apostasia shenzhenica TaxID=1088818 RepID=A0A2I0B3E2_9ASPA|nr:hypothetical protein AXF42_Ash016105 [Apostasia shenzhenica]